MQIGMFDDAQKDDSCNSFAKEILIPEHDLYFYNDNETTGFSHWRDDIIETAIIVGNREFEEVDSLVTNSAPRIGSNYNGYEAESIHGYCYEEILQFQPQRDACLEILSFLKKFKKPKSGYHPFIFHAKGRFDWSMLKTMFMKQDMQYELYQVFGTSNFYSTSDYAKIRGHFIPKDMRFGDNEGKDGLGLKELSKKIDFPLTHHQALSDARGCKSLHRYFHTGKKYNE